MLVGGLILLVVAGNLVISAAQLVGDALRFDPAVTDGGPSRVRLGHAAAEVAALGPRPVRRPGASPPASDRRAARRRSRLAGGGGPAGGRRAEDLAAAAGVSELVIGLTVVSIGTSAPEIVTSDVAAVRLQHGIAIGTPSAATSSTSCSSWAWPAWCLAAESWWRTRRCVRTCRSWWASPSAWLIVATLGGVPRRVGVAFLGGYGAYVIPLVVAA